MAPKPANRRLLHTAIAIGLPVVLWLATISFLSFEPSAGDIDIAAGSQTFRDHCGACHIVEKGITTHHGPNFYDIGRVAATRKPGMSAASYILESMLEPDKFVAPTNWRGMPLNVATELPAHEIRNVVAFLVDQGGKVDYDEIRQLDVPDYQPDANPLVVTRADMELAETVLRQKGDCLKCHSPYRNAEYRVYAPSLFAVGLSADGAKESIIDPNKVVSPAFHEVTVFLQSGEQLTGRLISRNEEQLVLLARNEKNEYARRMIPVVEIEVDDGKLAIESRQLSPMPTGFAQLLTEEELRAVLSLLQQLN
ncbi:MAG: c-type cytochrome [Planctomycetales bacterium]|nr:c-type cytochrome [Planctomycetales bacterium]